MVSQLNSNLAKIGTIYTGNPVEVTISGAYRQDAITEPITLTPGTYIFIIKFGYSIAKNRSVMVALSQNDWNLITWTFNTEKDGNPVSAYGKLEKSFVYTHKITSDCTYKIEVGINYWVEGETNTTQALLKVVRIA